MSHYDIDFSTTPGQAGPPALPPPLPGPPRAGRWGGPRPRRGPLVVLGGLALAASVAGGALALGVPGMTEGKDATTASYLVKPAGHVAKTACVDSSASVDKDGRLATQSARAIVTAVRGLHTWPTTPPTWQASTATPSMTLSARVVRRDSYSTIEGEKYVASADIGQVHGLSGAEPGADDPDARSSWADQAMQVGREGKDATADLARAADRLEKVLARHSNGSDVIGCVGAALEASGTGTSPDILVVSDLQDRMLTNADGSARGFDGDYSTAHVVIVQACPSGDQATCDRTGQAFSARLTRLGVSSVATYRPEQLDAAIADWLAQRP